MTKNENGERQGKVHNDPTPRGMTRTARRRSTNWKPPQQRRK
jgi:hypothetical protein